LSSKCNSNFLRLYYKALSVCRRKIWQVLFPNYRARDLAGVILKLRPDIIHTMETQSAGYLVDAIKDEIKNFPVWIHTLWGSDIYLFGYFPLHKYKIQSMLKRVNILICESKRDIKLALDMNYSGKVIKMQATGGFDLPFCNKMRGLIPIVERKIILLKGYQSWAGRALVGIRALERCSDILFGYTVVVYSADADVEFALNLFSAKTGIKVEVIPFVRHSDILDLQSQSRISISLSISDGVPNSMLESMAFGSFPIQSNTAATDELIINGLNGILVPPEDPEIIELAIRRAILDDNLVRRAFHLNWDIVKKNFDNQSAGNVINEMYGNSISPD
jgi:glycosyltransferase involved in cell wall biosynthesis